MKNATVLCAVMGAAIMFSGCKKALDTLAEKVIEKSLKNSGTSDAQVNLSNGKMSIKTDKGEMVMNTGDSVSLPADFPKDVYVAKDAKIQTALKTPDGFMIQFSIDQKKGKVAETYSSKMKDGGWASETSMDMGETTSLIVKKDNRQAAIIITQKDSDSEVMITVTTEK